MAASVQKGLKGSLISSSASARFEAAVAARCRREKKALKSLRCLTCRAQSTGGATPTSRRWRFAAVQTGQAEDQAAVLPEADDGEVREGGYVGRDPVAIGGNADAKFRTRGRSPVHQLDQCVHSPAAGSLDGFGGPERINEQDVLVARNFLGQRDLLVLVAKAASVGLTIPLF